VLAGLGFDVILVSASPRLDADDVRRMLPLCRAILRRDNIGLDFGSWQAAMAKFPDVWAYERMLLTNDSLFGPFADLGPVLARMEGAPELVCGLNDSLAIAPHLQSFFLYFKGPVLRDPTSRGFWTRLDVAVGKRQLIERAEIGLSQHLVEAGYPLFSAYPLRDVSRAAESRGADFQYREHLATSAINPSLMLWDILLTDFDYPYIKAELLRVNRIASNAVAAWRTLIPASASGVADDVERYLARVGVSAVPLPDATAPSAPR
jgi:hypothetical protein